MKNSFIIGIVWTAVIIGVISFGATIFFLDNNSVILDKDELKNEQKDSYGDTDDYDGKNNAYITDESSIRTNNFASLINENIMANNGAMQIQNMQKDSQKNTINDIEMLETDNEIISNNLETIEVVNENVNSFVKPVKGDIINPLSINELVYSKTLQEWKVHKGVDYKAQLGDEVYAIRKGKIKEINFNYVYGDYIVIQHDEGYESLYANITVLDVLKIGDDLKQGQVIGYVAESFGFEAGEETHLHFELKKDGKYISI